MKHVVEEILFKNGSKGLLIDVPNSEVVNILIAFNAGFLFADPNLPELPHVMKHLVPGANKLHPTMKEFEAEVEKNGASNNAFTNTYFLGYEMECAAFELERILGLLTAEITSPLFKENELKAEIGNVREELNRDLTNYNRVAYEALAKPMLDRRNTEESLASLDKITRAEIIEYYRRTHSTQNMRFVFAGAIRENRHLFNALDHQVSLAAGSRLVLPAEKPRHQEQPILIKKDIPQLYYRFVQYAEVLPRQAAAGLDIIGILLTNRYNSWIFGEARDKGLAYSVSSGGDIGLHNSSYSVSAYTTPANSEELFTLIAEKLRKACRGEFTESELEEAKKLLIGRRLRQYKTPGHLMNWYYYDYFAQDYIDDFHQALEGVKATTIKDLQSTMKHLFSTPQWGVSLVGDITSDKAAKLHKILSGIWA